tara:strand:- start:653 stop:1111 length:459 start_codon:yes stop_codon:yes gene_type:complete
MAKWATGRRSQAISDRSGMAFPYNEMVKEWTGSLVHYSEFEPKQPQIRRRHFSADAIALQNTRPQRFQTPKVISTINPQAPNDDTIASSGGQGMATANLALPGDFAFITAQPGASLTTSGVVISTMKPANPSLQNRRRQLIATTGTITVSIT